LRHTRWFRRIALFGFSIASTVALSALALAPALSSAATVTGTPEALPSCATVENGFDGRERAQVTTFADGGKLYTYELNGQKIVLPQPPADFEPLKASDELLERYAFPERPPAKEAERLKHWEEKMAAYRGTAPPVSCSGTPPRTGIAGEIHHTGTEDTANWSGYYNSDPSNHSHWNAAEADFFQINGAAHASCKSNAIFSSWVGLGGAPNGGLIQAGTDAFTNGTTAVWYEWLAGGFDESAYFPEMYVYPGDYIGFLVEYNVGTETASFITYDQNTGIYRAAVMPGLPKQFYDGSYGDFIHERPWSGTGYYPLLNFGASAFYYSEVRTAAGNWVWLGEANYKRVRMFSNQLLAAPVGNTINSFTDYYYACQ
jgi:Peptidase A4 family